MLRAETIISRDEAGFVRKAEKAVADFLERNAISKAQFDKSLHDMTEKMGYGETK